MNLKEAKAYIVEQLRWHLSDTLFYHGLHHTLDVVNAALHIAKLEGVTDAEQLTLLETAAYYHDSGFVNTYQGHEEASCLIARVALPEFDYSPEQIDIVCNMIMATHIPQTPKTHLEQIICDADLDYLGRADFELIATSLFNEMKVRNMVSDIDSWNQVQVQFIGKHNYWTQSAHDLRDALKQENLKKLL
ncbi:HD domain-containing protein [Dyadobacter sp. CY326]|uniref:HD domain-containing protein n=1 Tax=Dyadobacter sp. CY326 TaxID=2907300 RepID=UPI001F330F72|nr:HD domain-containing protein [Dyadobacter sp. CY326]MCE7064700.1 HD domain-containing protein [Dyadobacter sp. CY326]